MITWIVYRAMAVETVCVAFMVLSIPADAFIVIGLLDFVKTVMGY